ncbi:hypothetical protein DFH09DRAFT_931848, partial [Mycena vulgaris]
QPLVCLVLDFTPGAFRHSDLQRVLTLSLSGFKRLAGAAVASILYVALKTTSMISGRPDVHDFIRKGLNNPKILPWMNGATPRLYIYSDADNLSLVNDVSAHIEMAKEIGLNIREERFLGSPHVLHSRAYPQRYWDAVFSRWGDAARSKL